MKRLTISLTLIALSASLLSGCTTDGGSPAETAIPKVTGDVGQEATITPPKGIPPTVLYKEDLFEGSGAEAVSESTITVQYTLMSWTTGQVVESSWAQNGPTTFQLANLILGWQQGIPGMKEGGRRLLVLPPELGYGDDTLIFVIDLIKVA